MADEADRAQAQVDAFLADSLAAVKRVPAPPPVLVDGVSYCNDCGLEIPAARVKAMPGVGLCKPCQEDREQEWFA